MRCGHLLIAKGRRRPTIKAMRAGIPEATRRAWLIVERDWTRMAEREELKDAMSWLDVSSGRQAAMRNGQQKACTHKLRLFGNHWAKFALNP